MRTHVKLLLEPLSLINLPFEQRYDLSTLPLQLAEGTHVEVEKSDILMQCIYQHLFNIELFDYKVKSHFLVDFEVTENGFFLIAMQDGCSVLYNDADEIISEMLGNSCKLTYLKAGRYKRSLMGGNHQILLLDISPDWLISKYRGIEELKDLISSYEDGEVEIFSLPAFSIAPQVFNSLRKLNHLNKRRDIEIDLLIFLNDCMSRYLLKLHQGTITLKTQENKATEIAEFVKMNFASKIVGDEAELADHFMISTTMLTRLAKLVFDKPLHKQVIELRMHHGLKMLLSSQDTIQEISANVGYDDPKYFSRAFKKRFGIAPNEVRICV